MEAGELAQWAATGAGVLAALLGGLVWLLALTGEE